MQTIGRRVEFCKDNSRLAQTYEKKYRYLLYHEDTLTEIF